MPIASHPSPPADDGRELKIVKGHSFCPTGMADKDLKLFTVTPGIPVADAARSLCELLDALDEPIYATAMNEREFTARDAWLAKYTLDAAKAVACAIAHSLERQ
ncbi:DUF3077 domain-containing protein [Pantoea sp. Ap-967]|uniref:DUF3077 domain-containing protein n=1 Tax=Pantoea sp. Ap-967 TaxID=2608362 RepID=UPI00141D8A68|nr:DUF3077 domain-containing protein [Pantoea sp. Ap-967]NIE77023.1 DUF3077 domain-containing protein [Pantoea sp. Ap-967]